LGTVTVGTTRADDDDDDDDEGDDDDGLRGMLRRAERAQLKDAMMTARSFV
jgi:hypothetical protein